MHTDQNGDLIMKNRFLALATVGALGVSGAAIADAHNSNPVAPKAPIATVNSYTGGTLTLKTVKNDTSVAGKVTRRTHFVCVPSTPAPTTPGTTPDGTTPTGTTPDGTTPVGTTPDATTPDGTTPDATTPDGTTPVTSPEASAPKAATAAAARVRQGTEDARDFGRDHGDDSNEDDGDVCDASTLTEGAEINAATSSLTASGQKFTRLVVTVPAATADSAR
jgi:hypothetical protein